jgi:nitric oxide dioxygenase
MTALSERTIALVKATIPALEAHGEQIVQAMYRRLFENPTVRDLFNHSHQGESGAQPRALTNAILAYARNIDNPAVLMPAIERIAQKHVGLQVLEEHYPHVARALLAAIEDVLGDAATGEILDAWGEAYWFLAKVLIGREDTIYREQATATGGWTGWRKFKITRIRHESEVITSFVLRPVDGGPVLRHRPGQYLTFRLDIPGQGSVRRNYSISSAANGKTYRISVKREPMGVASNWLHDHAKIGTVLEVAPPAGEFFLAEKPERPVVLLSGGVGLTPMVAMLETIAHQHAGLPVHYIHGTLDGTTHAMGDYVHALAAGNPNIKVTTFYQTPRDDDAEHDQAGLIDAQWLKEHAPANADFFLCGPRPFLRAYVGALTSSGVPENRIHYEFFGPAEELLAA